MESISLKLIFRSWWRNKTFAVISLLSLAAGITCTNLLISYVIYESRIEAHNPNKSHIIYMAQDSPLTSGEKVSFIKGPIPVQLKDQYPEVEDYLRLNIENAASITIGEKRFDPISIVRADPSFPRFFPYKVMAGDINKALTQPNAIALTEYQAKIFFGNEDPIGKTFLAKYAYENETITYEVAAVIKEYPQSFLKFNALAGTTSQFNGGPTLLLVNDLFNIDTFTQKLKDDKVPTFNGTGQYYFYTLQESYFQEQTYTQEYIPYIHRNQKDLLYVGLFSAILILVIACFNVIGSLSMLILDKKEDVNTLRKLGADDRLVSRIFLFEGCMISFYGAIIGIILGLVLCWVQMAYGIVSLGGGNAAGNFVVDSYPVSVHLGDVIVIFITVFTVGFLSVWYPVRYLSKRLLKM